MLEQYTNEIIVYYNISARPCVIYMLDIVLMLTVLLTSLYIQHLFTVCMHTVDKHKYIQ